MSIKKDLNQAAKPRVEAQVRWLLPTRDIPEVAEIERVCFPDAWSDVYITSALKERNIIGMVAEISREMTPQLANEIDELDGIISFKEARYEYGYQKNSFRRNAELKNLRDEINDHKLKRSLCATQVIGHMIYRLHDNKLELLKFAVAPDFRLQGIGKQMATRLIDKLYCQGRKEILLDVRETNLGAQLFFRKQGFRGIEVLRGWYDDTGEDAFSLRYRLHDRVPKPSLLSELEDIQP